MITKQTMSAPTPQEIRDRLARVEDTLQKVAADLSVRISPVQAAMLADAKTNVLHAAATTLLVEQQKAANFLTLANYYETRGKLPQATQNIIRALEILDA